MTVSWPHIFKGLGGKAPIRHRRGRGRWPKEGERLRHEHLEQRALLAITAIPTGGVSDGLVVATAPNAAGQAADDAFVTRSAAGRLLVATDSSFAGVALQGNYATPDILYVTNGAADTAPGAMLPGDNRTAITGGPGYRQDAQLVSTTHFVIREGRVNNPEWALDIFDNPIRNPTPPSYPGSPVELTYLINNRVYGTISYDGGQWSFEEGPSGNVYIRQDSVAASGISLASVAINRKQQSTFGSGLRADVQANWSQAVASVNHGVAGVAQPPTADVRYVVSGAASNGSGGTSNVDLSRRDFVRPSANPSPTVSFDVFDAFGSGLATTIIEGTLKGTVTVDTFDRAANAVTLLFPFTTDINGGNALYFGAQTVGQNDWLTIRGTYLPSGVIKVEFRNAFDPDGSAGPLTADTYPVLPGAVTFKGPIDPFTGQPTEALTFGKYVTPRQPSDFTLWAGYDLPSQLWADMRTSGSTINIDSPVIAALPSPSPTSNVTDIDLRATSINVEARVQSRDTFRIGPSRAGNPSELVTIDANVAVPIQVDIEISDDPATRAVTRGQLFVSASGAIGAAFPGATVPATVPPCGTVLVTANSSDVFLEGVVAGISQSYLMRSYAADALKTPFVLTTTSSGTGASVGQIRGSQLQVLMANEADTPLDGSIAYNTVDIATAIDSLRVRASIKQLGTVTSPSGPFPYEFTLREEDGVSIDAVPSSSRQLSFASDGPMTWTAALATASSVYVATRVVSPTYSSFTSSGPITTSSGLIDIHASEMTLGSTVAVIPPPGTPLEPTRNDVTLTTESGNMLINGVLRSPNGISVVQRGNVVSRVAGVGRVRTGALSILANAVGRSDLSPTDERFFLRTNVNSVSADVQAGFAIDEVNDVAVSYLRSPTGLVAIRANGFDERPSSLNGPALSATLVDVGNLYVSAPNGSIDVRNDTGKRLQLGMPAALATGTVESMKAAGSVTIITSSGGIDVYDAPFAGSGARRVDAVTAAGIKNAAYAKGVSGQRASTIESGANASIQADPAFAGIGRVLRRGDRVLVKDGLRSSPGVPRDFSGNGVYFVERLGGPTEKWKLTRAADSDTFEELPTNSVAYDADKGGYWRFKHQILGSSQFGIGQMMVEGASDGFVPVTTITSSLVVPANDVRYVVSSSDGTNTGPGSLGKMIRLRQENKPVDPTLVQSIAFSRLLTQPVVLREELPAIRVPVVLDAAVAARVLPAGTTAPQGTAGIAINGQQITATHKGAALYRGTTSGTVSKSTPSRVVLSTSFPDAPELRVGMAVAGNGVVPGTVISSITPGAGSVGTVLGLSAPVNAIFNSVTNVATVSLTFSTEVNGFAFVGNAAGSRLAALNIGGFTSGAAVKVGVADPAMSPAWATVPTMVPVRGVTLDQVNIGSDGAAVPTRLGNQVGVLLTGNGTASVLGGQVTSNSIAGVRTIDQAGVWVYGAVIGTQSLPNIVGLDLGGFTATIGRMSSLQLPNAADTFVTFNRRGVVLRSGVNTVQNTLVSSNSFEGISIEGGINTIGSASRTRQTNGSNVADSNVISKNGTWGITIKSAALAATKVFDNVFGTDPVRVTTDANGSGNVGIDGILAGAPFVPNATTGLDQNGNQHGLRGAITPSTPNTTVPRPWQPRK
jgi:hypothetical protein